MRRANALLAAAEGALPSYVPISAIPDGCAMMRTGFSGICATSRIFHPDGGEGRGPYGASAAPATTVDNKIRAVSAVRSIARQSDQRDAT